MSSADTSVRIDMDILVVIKKIVYFTESDLSLDVACRLYLDGYLSTAQGKR